MNRESINDIIRDTKNYLELEKELGINEVMLPAVLKDHLRNINTTAIPPESAKVINAKQPFIYKDKLNALTELLKQANACSDCSLFSSRRNLVFGSGNHNASLMFVGEAPGLEEDIQGKPFVGKAGELLTKIIEAIGLKRQEVYIANCLKCRPPENRSPLGSEMVACRGFLLKQIEIIRPRVICCLGKFSAQLLLMSEEPITRLRGKCYNFESIKVIPTFHPAYLLRNPHDKRLVWEDMKKVKELLRF
jgi:DNA polymerase